MEKIKIIGESGKYPTPKPWIFRPVRAFRIKLVIYYFLILTLLLVLATLIYIDKDFWSEFAEKDYSFIFMAIVLVFTIIFTILSFIFIQIYVNSFEYQVHGTEIITKMGLVNITENHIPFSNITNISLRRGPLDQIFKIGSIIIHTAGEKRGLNTKIKLEGLYIYKEVGHYIVKEIKKVESFLTAITQDPAKKDKQFSLTFWKEFLEETKKIKYLFAERKG